MAKVEAQCNDHVQSCSDIELECDQCRGRFKRGEQHERNEACPRQDVTCECGLRIIREEGASHKQFACKLAPIPCPLNCGVIVQRYFET